MREVLYKDTIPPPKFRPICLRQNMVMPWKGMNSQICWRGVAELNPNRFIRDLHKQTVTKIFSCGMKCVWLANYLRVFDVSLGKTKANFPNEPIWVIVKTALPLESHRCIASKQKCSFSSALGFVDATIRTSCSLPTTIFQKQFCLTIKR